MIDRYVVEQCQRLRANTYDVVDIHRYAINPDGVI